MRAVFMGSPNLAAVVLRALAQTSWDVQLVVTQPPAPQGRGRREQAPPAAVAAAELGIPIFQPPRLRSADAVAEIEAIAPDVIVVAAYGQILPPSVLSIPRLGCINVHPSLLPRYRGAAPISGALLAGAAVTGVSIMLMDAGMDTGPVLSQSETPIADEDDQVSLTERLADLGADLLVSTLDAWAAGRIQPILQDNSRATTTRLTTRDDGVLDWTQPGVDLWRRVRAYAEWPVAHTWWNGKLLRIRRASVDEAGAAAPGVVVAAGPLSRVAHRAAVGTGRGLLLLDVVGLEGRQVLPIDEFLRGQREFIGAQLGGPTGI
jgi:methionyl-tRNA formyltransferase